MAAEAWREFAETWLRRNSALRWLALFQPHAERMLALHCLHAELIDTLFLLSEARVRETKLAWWIDECASSRPRHPLTTMLRSHCRTTDSSPVLSLSLSHFEDQARETTVSEFWDRHQGLARACWQWADLPDSQSGPHGMALHGAFLRLSQAAFAGYCPLELEAELAVVTPALRAMRAQQHVAKAAPVLQPNENALPSHGLVASLSARALKRMAASRSNRPFSLGELLAAWRARKDPHAC